MNMHAFYTQDAMLNASLWLALIMGVPLILIATCLLEKDEDVLRLVEYLRNNMKG